MYNDVHELNMYDALDVAKYIIKYSNEHDILVSNLKLQKLLYFVQANFLKKLDRPCFKDDILAWDIGPVVAMVYFIYCGFGSSSIIYRDPKGYDDYHNSWKFNYHDSISDDDLPYINEVIEKFADYEGSTLTKLTQEQSPWQDAYYKQNILISKESIKKFFE